MPWPHAAQKISRCPRRPRLPHALPLSLRPARGRQPARARRARSPWIASAARASQLMLLASG
eukprot:14344020-Alexandrium_andersonii.AAC.1